MLEQMVAGRPNNGKPSSLEQLRTRILENGKPRLNNSDNPSINSEIMYLEVGRHCRAFLEVDGLNIWLVVELESNTHMASVNEIGAADWLEKLAGEA
jgi:hypothetical protein